MDINKTIYLLTFQKENNKSAFLKGFGYSDNNPEKIKRRYIAIQIFYL